MNDITIKELLAAKRTLMNLSDNFIEGRQQNRSKGYEETCFHLAEQIAEVAGVCETMATALKAEGADDSV